MIVILISTGRPKKFKIFVPSAPPLDATECAQIEPRFYITMTDNGKDGTSPTFRLCETECDMLVHRFAILSELKKETRVFTVRMVVKFDYRTILANTGKHCPILENTEHSQHTHWHISTLFV